jgi:polysaccharide pyruvyl transferase WcaK-like protein
LGFPNLKAEPPAEGESVESYILVVGAYERDNFGDLLYPKILERVLSSHRTVKAGLLGRDLTGIGGDAVSSVQDYLRTHPSHPLAVIHCGGETITCLRKHGVSMDLPPHILKELSGLYSDCEEEVSTKLAPSENPFAYLYGPSDLSTARGAPLAFTSIGGTSLPHFAQDAALLSALRGKLEPAQFLSVRDRRTQRYLKEHVGVGAALHPDLASIVAKTHADEVYNAARDPEIAKLVEGRPYILFQADDTTAQKLGLDALGSILAGILERTKTALVLQPAGLASGHGDLERQAQLASSVLRRSPGAQVSVQNNRNLWTQVATIAHAGCCIATSLHVRIVSLSFARPCVSLSNEKVTSYAQTWEQDDRPYDVAPRGLTEAVVQAMAAQPYRLREASKYMMGEVESGLRDMEASLGLASARETLRESGGRSVVLAALSFEADRLREQVVREIVSRRALEMELAAVRQSTSWRLTAPLRQAGKRLREYGAAAGKVISRATPS